MSGIKIVYFQPPNEIGNVSRNSASSSCHREEGKQSSTDIEKKTQPLQSLRKCLNFKCLGRLDSIFIFIFIYIYDICTFE